MNKSTKFILGFHCHQPIGNFESVFKEIHEKSYKPLIQALTGLGVKFSFHASGVLLEWWEKNDEAFLGLIAEGTSEGRIELVGGGYYEPILAMIPRKDRIKQLNLLSDAYMRLFNKRPAGAWITERIWQTDIVQDLAEAGLNYAFLDDFQFFQAGIGKNDIDSIFRTEYNGLYLDIFPIHERLRYKLPFANPDESLREILYMEGRRSNISVMFDDGEKMGGWPDTHEWVYGSGGSGGWLERFIKLANGDEDFSGISFSLPSEVLLDDNSRIPAYLPISSYREMGEWTLTPDKRRGYETVKDSISASGVDAPVCGGIWHQFLKRYPEANILHKRMLNLSAKINAAKTAVSGKEAALMEKAGIELLKSQANDAYWHGVFGGIYLPHLRRAVHKALAVSYRLYRDSIKEKHGKELFDADMDGENEVLSSGEYWTTVYKPSRGCFYAIDYLGNGLEHSLGDVFCLHGEYDVGKLREESEKAETLSLGEGTDKKEEKPPDSGGGNPPKTIHGDVKVPSDLSADELRAVEGFLPSFEALADGKRLRFEACSNKKACALEPDGLEICGEGFACAEGNRGPDVKPVLRLGIDIGGSIRFAIDASSSGSAERIEAVFRLAFPGGDGPATGISVRDYAGALSKPFRLKAHLPEENDIFMSDSFWGCRVRLNFSAKGSFLDESEIVSVPLTTISLSESGYERIFQGIELKIGFKLKPGEDFRSIINMNVETLP